MRTGHKQTDLGTIPEDWKVVPLASLALFTSGQGISVASLTEKSSDCPVPVYGGNGIAGYTSVALTNEPTVVVGRVGQKCGEVYLTEGPAWITDNALYPRRFLRKPDIRFLALAMQGAGLNSVKNRNDLPLITQPILHSVCIALPPTVLEQCAIAAALSDVDALIDGLNRLIAKKRALKRAAMQRLLAGHTRLPGFSDAWEIKRLEDVSDVLKGRGLSKGKLTLLGARPCILYGELFTTYSRVIRTVVSRTDSRDGYPSVCGDILMPASTTTTGVDLAVASALLMDGVAIGGDINIIRQRGTHYDPSYLANYLTSVRRAEISELSQGITIHHLYGRNLESLSLKIPAVNEQTAIAAVLSDMDAEIAALQARRDKTRDLRHAMMQELLTGKTRLVQSQPVHA